MDSSDEVKMEPGQEEPSTEFFSQSKASSDKINSHRLIDMVKTHACLWNKENSFYCDKIKKDKAWLAICNGLDPNFLKLSKEKQYQTKITITKKWNNIRDSYRKYLKGKKSRPYLYSDKLTFLHGMYSSRRKALIEDTDAEVDDDNDRYEVTWLEDNFIEPDEDTANGSINETSQEQVEGYQNEHVISVLSSLIQKEEDDDRLFLKSLLPSIKSLKEETRMEFRIQVMKLIKVLKNKDRRQLKRRLSDVDWMGNDLENLD